jgi:predicted cobalt transporter CbtA
MTQAINWRHAATAVLMLVALVVLFHVVGAPAYDGG